MMPVVLLSLLVAAVAAVAVAYLRLRRRLVIVRVRGVSMAPTLHPGDRVLVAVGREPRVGQVVVFRPPVALAAGDDWLIKRAVAGPGDAVPCAVRRKVKEGLVPEGCLVVLGDNNESYDSRGFGYVRSSDVLGPVVRQLHR